MTMISTHSQLTKDQANAEYLGGKGYGLWWMQSQGVNVPPALIIPTTASKLFTSDPEAAMSLLEGQLSEVKTYFTSKFGYMPLLSIRSGARASMPGMMDTILNVGLDDDSIPDWQGRLGEKCVIDSYKRLIMMFGNVVKGVDRSKLEHDSAIHALAAYKRAVKEDFPQADQQILQSIEAVFKSWNNERAKVYRKMHNIPEDWGTAVVIQAMVFGNLNDDSGTGVLFTRDPDSGDNKVVGEFLINAQGEDVVAGLRTPMSLTKMHDWNPGVAAELLTVVSKLEKAKSDVQDVEFTIQDGKLYVLQTRTAKRSARAAVKIAMDMLGQGLIDEATTIQRVSARELDLADQPVIDPKFKVSPEYTGLPACSGVAVGVVATSSAEAVIMASKGLKVVMVTDETTPDDIKGMACAVGVLTMKGGSTSHAAVVARSMNRVCVVGLGQKHGLFASGQKISLDGATGRVWLQEVPVIGGKSKEVGAFRQLVLGQSSLLVDRAPAHKVKRLTLDLANHLVEKTASIVQMVHECAALCDELTVMVAQPTTEHELVVGVFLSPADITARLEEVREAVDKMVIKMSVIGWASNHHPYIEAVSPKDIESLIMLKKSGLLVGGMPAKKSPAMAKVLKWLAKDGVTLHQFNQPGGHVTWTVQSGL